jgi:8-oxo-dGTP pyrophosphatase MutT (NUDIX family)
VNTPRLAATVILVRPPFEVYLTRRSPKSAFAPDAFVFPGGTVDAQDRADSKNAPRMAAVRELFEEAGVLFARDPSGQPLDARATDWGAITAERIAVREGLLSFADFLRARGWDADTMALTHFSHWITPPSEPRRYDTHFFFAVAPPDQVALADAIETHDGIWIAPAQALARQCGGTMHLVYPTIKHLERLAAFDSVDAARDFARTKSVITVEPTESSGGSFVIPAELENAW